MISLHVYVPLDCSFWCALFHVLLQHAGEAGHTMAGTVGGEWGYHGTCTICLCVLM